VLGYSPLRGGPAYVPLGIAIGAGVGLGTDYAADADAGAIEALKRAVAAIFT
jgi:hypothetical protein